MARADLRKEWIAQVTINFADDEELMRLAEDWRHYTLTFPVAHYKHLSTDEAIAEMRACNRDFYSLPHIHPEYNLVICLSGGVEFILRSGERQAIKAGDLIMLNPGQMHESQYGLENSPCETVGLVIDRAEMEEILAEIQDGRFAREWILENQAGRPVFNALKRREEDQLIEEVGKELRSMMSWLKAPKS